MICIVGGERDTFRADGLAELDELPPAVCDEHGGELKELQLQSLLYARHALPAAEEVNHH